MGFHPSKARLGGSIHCCRSVRPKGPTPIRGSVSAPIDSRCRGWAIGSSDIGLLLRSDLQAASGVRAKAPLTHDLGKAALYEETRLVDRGRQCSPGEAAGFPQRGERGSARRRGVGRSDAALKRQLSRRLSPGLALYHSGGSALVVIFDGGGADAPTRLVRAASDANVPSSQRPLTPVQLEQSASRPSFHRACPTRRGAAPLVHCVGFGRCEHS